MISRYRIRRTALLRFLAFGLLLLSAGAGAVSAVDDRGREIRLAHPAQRIVSLAPHLTELLFELGVGEKVVGTSTYSNFPDAARDIPRVGSHARVDRERILALRPDLVLAWGSGNDSAGLAALAALGLPVFQLEIENLEALPSALKRLGRLTGSERGAAVAADFTRALEALTARYGDRRPVRTFLQIWEAPLMTVGSSQFLSDILRRCGGRNIFADQAAKTITIARESVLARQPEVIIALGANRDDSDPLARWRAFSSLPAVAEGHLYRLDGGQLARPTPRIVEGAKRLCVLLDQARER